MRRGVFGFVFVGLFGSSAAGAQQADTWNSPAKAADPPVLAAPSAPATLAAPTTLPTSTSGTDIARSTALLPPSDAGDAQIFAAQELRLRRLEERVANDERQLRRLDDRLGVLKHLTLQAFVQPQLLVQSFNAAASPNAVNGRLPPGIDSNDTIANADGTTTNGTFFRVRRARLRTLYETDAMRLFLQIDGLPAGGVGPGIGTILRQAEATGKVHWSKDVRTEITAGLFFTPFRKELLEASLFRPFIERTWFIQNAFPLERDYGVHAKTFAVGDRLVVDVSLVNGSRLGEKTFTALPDLSRSKDGIGYVTYKMGPVTLGVSGYLGKGQIVDVQQLRFKQFSRWAVNYQASIDQRFIPRLGETRLSSELTIAQNMDAGVIYAFAVPTIPANFRENVANLDQRAFYIRAEQDLGRWAMVGYRFDTYTPNTAIKNNGRDTHAFLLVAKISPNLRWMNEFGAAFDNVHAINTPPPSKHITYLSSVLQAMF